ncbi:hypothetical protein HU200_004892 [Digitaria exilis]|uniref:non-specific serine/threonine protein kinase n=1 Tax=Digitaria exilis TaxID=1010633 RepID=A0A835KTP1_9POAL|nr:hypothetical protein HU200_004892 [Digitaria exilis]
MGRYEIGKQLGQGTFAKVFYARNLTTNQAVAIKMINKDKVVKVGLMEQIKREISIMRLVKHPNVLQLFEVMASKSKIYFVLEYAKGGELFNKIAKGGKLSEDAARKYFHQLISAVDYCHSRDFGLSALAESKRQDGLLHTTCGTPAYVAPEVLSRKGYDGAKADIWSCGIILFVLVAGYLPFHDTNLMEMYRKISRAEFRCPRGFSTDLKDLLHKILDPDPSTRISISRIKRHAWYRKPVEANECSTSKGNQGSLSLPNLNAFDIISLSTGFNLSRFFEDKYGRREERFTTRQPATTVFTKLKELSKRLKLKVKKKENGTLKLAAPKEGKKGVLELDAEIFEVAPSLLLVELKKTNGDTMEYQKLVKEEIRPALKDIVWVWQGDQHQHSQPTPQEQQSQPPISPQQPHELLQASLTQQEQKDMLKGTLAPQEPLDQLQSPSAQEQPPSAQEQREQLAPQEPLYQLQSPSAQEQREQLSPQEPLDQSALPVTLE